MIGEHKETGARGLGVRSPQRVSVHPALAGFGAKPREIFDILPLVTLENALLKGNVCNEF